MLKNYQKFNKNSIKKVSCCSRYSAILTYDGALSITGKFFKKESKTFSSIKIPSKVSNELVNPKIIKISTGSSHLLILTKSGHVFGVGSNVSSAIGVEKKLFFSSPQLITAFNEKVKSVWCGSDLSFFLTESDKLYSCGDNYFGTLCLPNDVSINVYKPQLISPKYFDYEKIEKVIINGNASHAFFLTTQGSYFVCGWASIGALGTFTSLHSAYQKTPSRFKELNNIKTISCGGYHTLYLLNNGSVYSSGMNDYGQCGFLKKFGGNVIKIVQIKVLKNERISKIETGTYQSFFWNFKGELFVCGNGMVEDNTPEFGECSSIVKIRLKHIKSITGGLGHAFFMSCYNDLIVCGGNLCYQLGLGHNKELGCTFFDYHSGSEFLGVRTMIFKIVPSKYADIIINSL